eukprot:scaffold94822_cov25-Tisochrysis_lutea.AAC.8
MSILILRCEPAGHHAACCAMIARSLTVFHHYFPPLGCPRIPPYLSPPPPVAGWRFHVDPHAGCLNELNSLRAPPCLYPLKNLEMVG